MDIKFIIGLVLAFSIGFACSKFSIAVPAPPQLEGALLVLALTIGYVLGS